MACALTVLPCGFVVVKIGQRWIARKFSHPTSCNLCAVVKSNNLRQLRWGCHRIAGPFLLLSHITSDAKGWNASTIVPEKRRSRKQKRNHARTRYPSAQGCSNGHQSSHRPYLCSPDRIARKRRLYCHCSKAARGSTGVFDQLSSKYRSTIVQPDTRIAHASLSFSLNHLLPIPQQPLHHN